MTSGLHMTLCCEIVYVHNYSLVASILYNSLFSFILMNTAIEILKLKSKLLRNDGIEISHISWPGNKTFNNKHLYLIINFNMYCTRVYLINVIFVKKKKK